MNKEKLRKIFTIIFVTYLLVAGLFYALLGDQLRYKNSNRAIVMPVADSATDEIIKNHEVSQTFINKVDRLQSISFLFTKFYREAYGNVQIQLLDSENVIFHKTISIKDILEQQVYTVYFDEAIEKYNEELTIVLKSTSNEGHGVALMFSKNNQNGSLINDGLKKYHGDLCFATAGIDEIKASKYYWYYVMAVAVLLLGLMIYSYRNYLNGKRDLIICAIANLYQYEFLIQQLVSRDFKSKYKRSLLGVFWSFLNPLLTMIVQFLVFSTFFKADTQNYPVYLLSGVICFNFFKETTDMCLNSITSNANLINKVYIPKYIFPMAKTISCSINLGMSLIPLLVVSFIMGIKFSATLFLILFFLICLVIFTLGVGMLLATLMVFFRDIQFLWGVMAQIWMYATPIFYPSEIIPEKYRFIVRFNPLYHFIGNIRKCLIDGISPEPISYIYCLIFACAMFIFGAFVFKRNQDKFTLYL